MFRVNSRLLCSCSESKVEDSQPPLLLFSSDDRELYVQDIYNSMAYQPGMTIQFRYDEDWIADSIDIDDIQGRKALIVASPRITDDSDNEWIQSFDHEGEYLYFPLRLATVKAAYNRGDMQHLYLELDHILVDYTEVISDDTENHLSEAGEVQQGNKRDQATQLAIQMTNAIGQQEVRPIESDRSNSNDKFLVEADNDLISNSSVINFTCDYDLEQVSGDNSDVRIDGKGSVSQGIECDFNDCWEDSTDEWASIVTALSSHSSFKSNLFMKLEKPRISSSVSLFSRLRNRVYRFRSAAHPNGVNEGKPATIKNISTESGPPERAFSLYSGYQYRMRSILMYAGDPEELGENSVLSLDGGSYLDVFPEKEPLGFRVNEVTFTVDPIPQKNHRHSELTLDSTTPDNSTIEFEYDDDKPIHAEILPYKSVESSFMSPNLRIPVRLWPDFNYRRGPLILAIIGILVLLGHGVVAEALGVLTPQFILNAIPQSIRFLTEDVLRIAGLGITTYGFNIYEG